ncbi:MAG: beta-lactamase family protein [Verrucomicrobia bacterium]|nr:beta-lactamase family protein [Verrucomicrobiota bacterium]
MKRIFILVTVVALQVGFLSPALPAQPLPAARPVSLGFSPQRLERLHAMVQEYIDQGKHAGAITLIARDGRIADAKTYGWRDLEGRTPMTRDTIVRVYSMSKVITSAAVLQLVEEARVSLDDPISRYILEFKDLKVCTGGTPDAPVLENAKRPIAIKHLLTHTAGFAYEFSAKEPVKTLYQRADVLEAPTLKDFIERLAKLPLVQQPGEAFFYGVNTDVLGYLVEVVTGKPLEVAMQERLFDPLGMKDTGFDVPAEKMPRLAKLYENGPDGKLRPVAKPPYGSYPEKGRSFPSGGGGLFSTADDYLRFAQMLLNGGKLDGKQILGRKTVELMTANHLTFLEKPNLGGNGSEGFGLGGSVRLDVASGNTLSSVGEFGWNGAATTTFRIDPKEKTVALLFTQHLPYNQHGIFAKFYTLFYASLVD